MPRKGLKKTGLKTKTAPANSQSNQRSPNTPDEHDGLDVSTEADVGKLMELLKRNVVVLGIIHMDGCHYCETIKPVLEKYKNAPNRKVPIVKINRSMLTKTPFNAAKIDGFPSGVLYSPKDKSFGSFKKDDGEETHAIPNLRDEKSMIKLLESDPKLVQNVVSNIVPDGKDSESLHATSNAEALLEESGKKAIKEKDIPLIDMNEPLPPNTSADTVSRKSQAIRPVSGGSLLSKIMRYVEEALPTSSEPSTTRRRKLRKGTRKRTKTLG
jgi:thiol-disulfide isomerase/thioredoxin